jgi:hypothetical protein
MVPARWATKRGGVRSTIGSPAGLPNAWKPASERCGCHAGENGILQGPGRRSLLIILNGRERLRRSGRKRPKYGPLRRGVGTPMAPGAAV